MRNPSPLSYFTEMSFVATASAPHAVQGEAALWRAVILQALQDAVNRSRKAEARFHRTQAQAWLSGGKEFVYVCDLALLDPGYVRRMAKRALARGCKWRAEAGKGKRKKKSKKNSKISPPSSTPHTSRTSSLLPFRAAA